MALPLICNQELLLLKHQAMNTKNEVIVLTDAGQIGMAIVRRMAYGKKIIVSDRKMENAQAITKTLLEAGFMPLP